MDSSGYHRLTRAYPPAVVLEDRPGRYIYVRDRENGEFWSLNWQPVRKEPSVWECRHGLGYTVIRSTRDRISGEIRFFVPLRETLEVWQVKLRNEDSKPRLLDFFTYTEWSLGNYAFDLLETWFANLFNQVEYEGGVIYATKRLWNVGHHSAKPHATWDRYAFLATDFPVKGYECMREQFLGPYRSLADPVAVERGRCSNRVVPGQEGVAVFHGQVDLDPGEEYSFVVLLGTCEDRGQAEAALRKYRGGRGAEGEFQNIHRYWQDYLDKVWVETPDPDFDLSVNIWNKYQAWFTSHWARMASYYLGGGSIIGVRDSSQDMLGIMPAEPERARRRILDILRHQYHDGSTLHNWDPVTDTGPKTGHSDDPLWLVLTCLLYVKESGDMSFLDQEVEYYDDGQGTVYDHLCASLAYTMRRSSRRGIPLIGAGDWNDALDQVGIEGRGESVMVAEHLAWMLKEMAEVARRRGDSPRQEEYMRRYHELRQRVNEFFWDGEWYIRATTDNGEPLGSRNNPEGKIYLNAQTWSVLSGIAPPDRAVTCMDAVRKHLDTPYGPALFLPAYQDPDPSVGIITMFVPGTKENGTIFNHPVAWAIIAEAMLGRADHAFSYFKKSSFVVRGRDPELYRAEPYVYAEYVYGPDSPLFGQGEFTWTTGTAPWMWRACLDWILGIRPEYDGLLVDPCLPPAWEGFRARRFFRGATYEIEVANPRRVARGVAEVLVDGRPHPSNLLPVFGDGRAHKVRVMMG